MQQLKNLLFPCILILATATISAAEDQKNQQQSTTDKKEPQTQATDAETPATTVPTPTAQQPQTQAQAKKSSDTFIPSESISEDLAVSFPVDI